MNAELKPSIFLSVILIVALGFAAYGNSLDGAFLWDDIGLVKNNAFIKSWSHLPAVFKGKMAFEGRNGWNFYRPLQMVTYTIDYSIWNLKVKGYHLTNILLHISAALGIYWLIRTLFKDNLLSLLTAAFFVVHPVHSEAVAYISGRADPLAFVFMLLCLLLYINSPPSKGIATLVLMLASYAAALLSKESSLVLPVLILLYHYTFKTAVKVKEFLPLAGLAFFYIGMRLVLLKVPPVVVSHSTTLVERAPGFFAAATQYIRLLFFPLDLHMAYGGKMFTFGDPKAILGVMILFAALFYAFRKRESGRLVSFSILWFFLTLLPVSNLYPINAYMAEHWLYLPSVGFFLMAAKAISLLCRMKCLRIFSVFLISGLLGFYAFLTNRQNLCWREPINFYERNLRYAPDSPELYNNLGNAYQAGGRYEDAIAAYEKAAAIKPDYARAYYNLGNAYKTIDRNKEAIVSYKKAVEIRADYAEAYYNLGVSYKAVDRIAEAMNAYENAIRIKSDYAEAHNNLGSVYLAFNRTEEAIQSYETAIHIRPDYAMARGNLALVYVHLKQYPLAIECYDKAKALGYANPELAELLEPYRREEK
ncbi:MAG: tetratricopeptide repeat protein [Candidatus Omnitrophica bacterium]|nr:tetratricopeptide repeat protein [Candidatus Omnitrophota bacterium]